MTKLVPSSTKTHEAVGETAKTLAAVVPIYKAEVVVAVAVEEFV